MNESFCILTKGVSDSIPKREKLEFSYDKDYVKILFIFRAGKFIIHCADRQQSKHSLLLLRSTFFCLYLST